MITNSRLYLKLRKSVRIRHTLGRIKDHFLDLCHWLANHKESALPPPTLRDIGDRDFHFVGSLNARNLKKFTDLDGKTILEIGCGSGRNALALTTYDMEYHGLDIYKPYINWCSKHITKNFKNFHFYHADVYNGQYNPDGKQRSEAFELPFESARFDLVFLTSVFTHMLELEVKQYFSEIARVLKPNGHLYATFFLLNKESNRLIFENKSTIPMESFDGNRVKVMALHIPELAVGFEEKIIVDEFNKNSFSIKDIQYGSWCGRHHHFDYQDVIYAQKTGLAAIKN